MSGKIAVCRNKWVFSFRRNTGKDGADVMSSGRVFQSLGPATANERSLLLSMLSMKNVTANYVKFVLGHKVSLPLTLQWRIHSGDNSPRPILQLFFPTRFATFVVRSSFCYQQKRVMQITESDRIWPDLTEYWLETSPYNKNKWVFMTNSEPFPTPTTTSNQNGSFLQLKIGIFACLKICQQYCGILQRTNTVYTLIFL